MAHYDARAGMEAELKSDKGGLGLAAQKMVVVLVELAHKVLVWSRTWLSQRAARLGGLGMVWVVGEVWAIPGRVKLTPDGLRRVRLRPEHPWAREVAR